MVDPVTRRALFLRAFGLWLAVRLVFTALSGLAGSGIRLAPLVIPLFAGVVGATALIDLRAVRDDTFLADLGIGARHVFGAAFVLALLVESAIALIAGSLLAA